jgi:hypothetical protein
MIGPCGASLAVLSFTVPREHAYFPMALTLLFVLISIGIARTTLRAVPLYGSERGLWVRSTAGWKVIAWRDIEDVDHPTSSFNPVFRIYRVHLKVAPPIYFLPRNEHLAAIASFRRRAALRPLAPLR